MILQSIYTIMKSQSKNFTANHYIDLLKGSKIKKIKDEKHDQLPAFGLFKNMQKTEIERLIRKLISDGFLKEDMVKLQFENIVAYVAIGQNAKDLYEGKIKFEFPVAISANNAQQALPNY